MHAEHLAHCRALDDLNRLYVIFVVLPDEQKGTAIKRN